MSAIAGSRQFYFVTQNAGLVLSSSRPLPWEPEEIANLFFIDMHAPRELRLIHVLKLERQRLIVKKLWACLKLIVQVWPS